LHARGLPGGEIAGDTMVTRKTAGSGVSAGTAGMASLIEHDREKWTPVLAKTIA